MMDATAVPYGRGDAPEVSKLRASEAHLLELRKIHSMLHSAMDALIKDLNANEAARLLILLDDRLTSLINTADVERDQETGPRGDPEKPAPAAEKKVPPATKSNFDTDVAEKAAKADRPSPPWRQPPAPAPAPVPVSVEPSSPPMAAGPKEEALFVPSEPILAVPPAAEAPETIKVPIPSFEDMIASATKASLAAPQPSKPEPIPAIEAISDAPAEFSKSSEAPKSEDERPVEAAPDLAPVAAEETGAEPGDDEPEWIEEDFEDGADLREDRDVAGQKQGLAGRFLSRFRLPGLGRRQTAATDKVELSGDANEPAEAFADNEGEPVEEAAVLPPETAPATDPKIRRLHAAADQLSSGRLLDEAAQRTGNRIELRKVDFGLDLVVKGLPKPLGTVRIAESDGHVLYQPGFGLDLPNREPNRVDLEIWTKAMGDVVVRVLEDIGRRRKGGEESGPDGNDAP